MAVAAAACWFTAGTSFSSLTSHRLSSSSSLFIPKALHQNSSFHSPSQKAVGKQNFRWRSKDERHLANKDGRSNKNETGQSQLTAFKSSGLQRKGVGKGAPFESKELQVETGIIEDAAFLNAVVKVFCTHTAPDYSLPWQKQRQFASTGRHAIPAFSQLSAFMIGDGKLLTNAHCVEHGTQVKVKRRGDDTKYVAKVLARGVECDIALLTVENKDFWKGAEPLHFGHLPHLQDAVTVVGYPLGGDTISVTKGVVSRVEVTSYAHGSSELLGIQIDAAINPGNSGGPAFNDDGECIGVAFQVYRSDEVENIGYVIPTTVVSHFLEDYERNGKYNGFPCLGVLLQKLENPALRACLRVSSNEGVLVRKIEPTSDVSNVLKEGDVIVSFDGVRVGSEGTVPFRSNERIAFRYLISQKFTGDVAELGIIRAGEFLKVQAVLKPRVHLLKLLTKARYSSAKFEGEQIVILSQILKMNGTRIRNIHHLAHLVDSCKDKYLVFEFEDNFLVVLEREAASSASSSILKDYGIPAERSLDLLEPYIDSIGPDEATDQHEFGDSPVSNSEFGYDGLLWA
ncbi:Protease Do-like 2, chloroplastic [Capsicum annuum]|nr:Protease Do-like 2, chloroplastic [Capsicum annuum]KAF3667593.1 Protease Do-like 2, chloroplastic [Capsicum annuum]